MRRITLAVLSTIAVLVLLLSYRTSLGQGVAAQPAEGAHVVTGSGSDPGATTGQGPDPAGNQPGGASGDPTPGTTLAAPPSTANGAAATTVVDGDAETTRYGPVQVQLTITGGTITDVTAIQYPTAERRDREINTFALPQLRAEVLAAQGANVDAVSGATYTTQGYLASLQSALDAAHRTS